MKKLLLLIIVPGLIIGLTFALWGDFFDALFNQQRFIETYQHSPYAWIIGILLLAGDLFLPIPASAVMSAMGSLYGVYWGTAISFCGSCLAGFIAYLLARVLGKSKLTKICTAEELDEYEGLFNKWGAHAVIICRAFPILPEVITLLAGFSKMNFRKFSLALIAGTLPVSFLFTYLGHISVDEPYWGMAVAVVIPLGLWMIFSHCFKAK
ncbi:MAG: VTT domain-containing protein [Lentisphaeraceae bacterium]|nr:VTT domain-containing protein [Lentisphaeraceae bacterium]